MWLSIHEKEEGIEAYNKFLVIETLGQILFVACKQFSTIYDLKLLAPENMRSLAHHKETGFIDCFTKLEVSITKQMTQRNNLSPILTWVFFKIKNVDKECNLININVNKNKKPSCSIT